VFLGEMSLVGPRPCLPAEYEQFGPRERQRSEALPGLTGLWQVSGKNRTTFSEMIDLDVRYTREFSPWLDFKIIFMTLPCLLMQVQESRRTHKSSLPSSPSPTVSVPVGPQTCPQIVSVSVSVSS
jgi:lipopolysaccharide/colanic/teichoic acid biosynthesis glycosyltransferase